MKRGILRRDLRKDQGGTTDPSDRYADWDYDEEECDDDECYEDED